MRLAHVSALALATLSVVVSSSFAGGSSRENPERADQGVPEYGILLSGIAGALASAKPVFTCTGLGVSEITEALHGPGAVDELATTLVAEALGSPKKPWRRNTRAYSNEGRQVVPDFVKEHTFYVVDTGARLELTQELRDLRAIARRRGWKVVVVTPRNTTLSPALSAAVRRSWAHGAGRIQIVRCV